MNTKIPEQRPQIVAAELQITHQKTIKSGRAIERLALLPGDRAFNVAAKKIQKGFSLQSVVERFTHVKVKTADGSFHLNVRSTAKRLGLTHQEVRNIAAKGDTAVATLKEKATIRKTALEKYEAIAQKYEKEKGKLQTGELKTGITPKLLLKVIQKGMTIEGNAVIFRQDTIETGKKVFKLGKDLSSLHIVQKRLGGGTFGVVFKTIELTNAQVRAVKVPTANIASITELANERNVLEELNRNGPQEGLPGRPATVTNLSHEALSQGFMDIEFMNGGDLRSGGSYMPAFQVLPAGDRLRLCGQLLSGLAHMHEKGYSHGDIKPENCLAEIDPATKKPRRFVIADHGSTTQGNPRFYTELYRPSDHKENKLGANQSDVFALSKSLLELLGCTDYNFFRDPPPEPINTAQAGLIRDHLAQCGIPKEVANVLIRGLAPASMRPSIQELKQAYDKAVASMTEEQKARKSDYSATVGILRAANLL